MTPNEQSGKISIDESGAFVDTFSLPPTAGGPLAGLKFAVKDLIDLAGHPTGCGNPTWKKTHPPATTHAVCVEQLLSAGATCVGKTVTDELAFSLMGENHWYGTPLNPAAPTRVPGGSSSGSASAVACGLADFALGTDTGGSVRVPASHCGLWALRPSHDRISLAGVMPFAPCYDTVGMFASSGRILERVASVLLAEDAAPAAEPERILLVKDALDLIDADARQALEPMVEKMRSRWGQRVETIGIEALTGKPGRDGFETLWETFCVLQWAEIESSLGAWIADARPEFGPAIEHSFELVHGLDRRRIGAATEARGKICRRLAWLLGPRDLLCYPTTPGSAPEKGASAQAQMGDWYHGALSLGAIAGIGRLPQVVIPGARTAVSPVGLSLIGAWGQDMAVIAAANRLAEGAPVSYSAPPTASRGSAQLHRPAEPSRRRLWPKVAIATSLLITLLAIWSVVSNALRPVDYSRGMLSPEQQRRAAGQ